ncbi:SulP family inorganic anion transporter [Chelatococcus sambhunathii]|uniref:SulP family inorganic anion transporter n=1 Tax=Chelatococcus sambhunathii TaxID=363953 RepID=A0ABU1DKW2_9HYPH|nr:SulP family inorganic anion transporter [Chelatococcus sambhunathii]
MQADAAAGLLGALLVLAQGIAFATLAGLPPQYGLYSAVVPTIVAAVFGSSLHVVSGPTNANSLAIFAAITPLAAAGSPDFISLALAVTVMVGVIQFAVGATRLGRLTDFLSPSVLLGFTGGAATLIACYALPDAFDLPAGGGHGPFREVAYVFEAWRSINPAAAAVAAATLAVTLVARKLLRPAPFMLIGLAAGWLLAECLRWTGVGAPVEVVGPIPIPIPPLTLPIPPLETLPTLIPLAGALAIIALGQSVSIAKTVAQRSGQRIEVNREFIGQGLSNIAGGFFSSYLSCGSLNRSIPNLEAGARTPLAAVMAALILVALVAVASPVLRDIPTAAIAALLLYTAYSLLEVRRFLQIWKISRTEFAVGIVTFVSMLFFAFHVAILAGVAFSLVVFLHRSSHPHIHSLAPDRATEIGRLTPLRELKDAKECPQLKLLRIEGATYFGAAQYVSDRLADLRMRSPTQKRLLVMARSMNFIDVAGAEVWENELVRRRQMGGDLYFHRPRGPVMAFWRQTGFVERLGLDHFFNSKGDAIAGIFKALDPKICQGCQARIFHECGEGSPTSMFDLKAAGGPQGERRVNAPPAPPEDVPPNANSTMKLC